MAGSPNRNAPCPCGSGRKYKSCCLRKGQAAPLQSRSGGRAGSARPALPADASNTRELLRQARDLRRLSHWGQAVTAYRAVLERRPRDAEALFGLGQSLARINEPDAALACTRQAVEIEPGNGDYHVELAWQLGQANQPDPALHHARRAVELVPNNVKAHYTLALLHERANRLDDAAKSIERALRNAPDDANAGIIGAVLARRRGDPTDARRRLEAIVARSPGDQYLAWALNELARACDELEAWDDAWTAIVASGEALGRTSEARRPDRDTYSRLLAAYRDAVTPELLLRHSAVEPAGGRAGPVFLVGFPRSGTTMTEMLMAAHPDVVTASEEPIVQALKAEILRRYGGDLGDVPRHLDRLTGADVADLRQLYWTRAEAVVGEPLGEKVLVDKLPMHIVDLGLINVIFPDAKILVALRDPRDVCLSCLMQWFRLNIAMVHFLSLADTAAFYAAVMGFWQAIRGRLTLRSMEVRYEDTVTDLPGQARRILDLLGVDWNDSVLSFHEQAAGRSIFTPSYTTVIEKVHTRAIGRWRNYERHFEPVQEILAPYVTAFGYS